MMCRLTGDHIASLMWIRMLGPKCWSLMLEGYLTCGYGGTRRQAMTGPVEWQTVSLTVHCSLSTSCRGLA